MAPQRPSRQSPSASVASAPRSSRHAKPTISYLDPSSDEDDEDEEIDSEADYEASPGRRRGTPPSRSAKRRRTASPPPARSESPEVILYETRPKRRQPPVKRSAPLRRALKEKIKPETDVDPYSAGIIPPWQTLPYHVLLQIFEYASYPLVDERTFQQTASWAWLLKASKLCRAFSEPALTVLYRSPCLTPMERAHTLCDLLKANQIPMLYNYRSKIEQLQIEVQQTAAYTLSGSGLLDLHGLVFNCPRLLDLEIYHQKDLSPYRRLDETIKWRYPPQLFQALANNVDGVPTRLRSWRWSSRMVSKQSLAPEDFRRLIELHSTPSFRELRKIAFVNYQMPEPPKKIPEGFMPPEYGKILAEAISLLPNLEHLIFEASTLVDKTLLTLLPRNLKHLDIIACGELVSDELAEFLLTHGSQLRTLTLNHNQALSLSFLTILGAACPHLRSLKMNLTYYNLHMTYKDSEPFFDHLLLPGEVPSWPSTLQTLELIQLRKWEVEAAEMFFRSLLDSAGALPDLRILVIKAILDSISWRDRGGFRDRWMKAFERVFKRKSPPPDPHLRSIGAYEAYKARLAAQAEAGTGEVEEEDEDDIVIPRSTRKPSPVAVKEAEPKRRTLRSATAPPKRRRVLARLNYKESSSSSSEEEAEESETPQTSEEHEEEQDVVSKSSPRKRRGQRELEDLKRAAGFHRMKSPVRDSALPTSISVIQDEEDSDDDVPLRLRSRRGSGGKEDKEAKHEEKETIQGMCEIVDFKIDNLRPTENQWREDDFLDSEPEGDEDWDGTNEAVEDYAW